MMLLFEAKGGPMRALLLVGLVLTMAGAPSALAGNVVVLSTIQAAVDAAQPGDTVIVPPGRYHESVTIAKSGITIRGSRGAVLDASGFSTGIRAASGPGGLVCPPLTLHDLAVEACASRERASPGSSSAGSTASPCATATTRATGSTRSSRSARATA
jgi:pectin methylesterase-like acyl-CoA thioesterase